MAVLDFPPEDLFQDKSPPLTHSSLLRMGSLVLAAQYKANLHSHRENSNKYTNPKPVQAASSNYNSTELEINNKSFKVNYKI